MNEPCTRRLSAGQLGAVSGQCASVRRHHRHRSPDTLLAMTSGGAASSRMSRRTRPVVARTASPEFFADHAPEFLRSDWTPMRA